MLSPSMKIHVQSSIFMNLFLNNPVITKMISFIIKTHLETQKLIMPKRRMSRRDSALQYLRSKFNGTD